MAFSKVILNGTTLIDLTSDTIGSSSALTGKTGHGADGEPFTGVYEGATINNQDKSVTPSESAQSVTYDSGYTGLGTVSVGAISSTYIGSDITQDPTPTVSGATVTIPTGYYSADTTKSVASGSAKTPATTITANPTISVSSSGLITASASATKSVTPTVSAGYVSSGTSGTITVSGSNTSQLSTQSAKTITPTTSSQTAVTAGKYTTGAITVGAIPSQYKDTSSGDITASDVVSGKVGFNASGSVTGTLVVQTYYTGSSNPSSSLGDNGDIYLKVVT